MKKFKFNLENVLKQREILEKLAQKKFHALRKKIKEEKQVAQNLKEKIIKTKEELKTIQKQPKGKLEINTIKEYQSYINYMEDALVLKYENIKILEAELEDIRQALIHAAQNKKIIARLKEKAFEEYMDNVNKAEEKFLDEITTMRHKLSKKLYNY